MILSDLGADVIKVEDTRGGDETRHRGPPSHGEDAAYYHFVNRNKRSLALDLKSEAGRDLVLRLADSADVVIENFRPRHGRTAGAGLRGAVGAEPRARLWLGEWLGQTGPMSQRAGYHAIAQAMSGS